MGFYERGTKKSLYDHCKAALETVQNGFVFLPKLQGKKNTSLSFSKWKAAEMRMI